jgi:hypothetical protein
VLEQAGAAVEVPIWFTRPDIDTAGIAEDCKGWLFRTSPGHNATELTAQPMTKADAWRVIRRRAIAAGIFFAPIGNHAFWATGSTAYLGNGGALEHAPSDGAILLAPAFEPRGSNAGSRLLRPPAAGRGSMNSPPLLGHHSGRNLSRAKHCLDEAGHLSDGDHIPHRMPWRPFESVTQRVMPVTPAGTS